MIDYRQIIEDLTDERVVEILNKLGIPFKDCGSYFLMPTACHNVDLENASYKLYYYKNTHTFMCYTSCESQSIFRFLKNFYEVRNIEYDWYNDIYLLITGATAPTEGFQTPKYRSMKEDYTYYNKEVVLPIYNEGALGSFTKFYPVEWLKDGITKKTMDKFEILYSISQNKIVIPHRDVNNRLIGIRGRSLNDWEIENIGKYMPIKLEQTWYKHPLSMNLYALNINKDNIKNTGICYICESEKSVLQMESFSIPNCAVAVCGSAINKFQIHLLIKYCQPKEIVVCFDKEEKEGEDKYFMKLWNICQKYKNYANFSFIYDRENLLSLKDSPMDKGEEIFKKLLERRVNIK